MVDMFSKEKRSDIMSKIRSKNTKPELMLRKALFKAGARGYRLKSKLPGSPDLAYTKAKVAVFVDGCFWHGCPTCYSEPGQNKDYWKSKLERNKERDYKANEELKLLGWKIIRFWEHQVKKDLSGCVQIVLEKMNNAKNYDKKGRNKTVDPDN